MKTLHTKTPHPEHSPADRELGVGCPITRRDFVNSVAVGAGAALLGQHAPLLAQAGAAGTEFGGAEFDGFGGVGDYARANGNTWEVLQSAHAMRDGEYGTLANVIDTGEMYDVVVVGGGCAGIGAAHRVAQLGAGKKTCLVLDNHRIFGGESRRNEFMVNGVRLIAPQGANECHLPPDDLFRNQMWDELDLPREFTYGALAAAHKPLELGRGNYVTIGTDFESHGYYFPEEKRWVRNPWGHDLAGVPWPEEVKRDLLRSRHDMKRYYSGSDGSEMERWLDSMSYEHYLTRVMGLRGEVARYMDAPVASVLGLGSDVTSAYAAWALGMEGMQGLHPSDGGDRDFSLRAANPYTISFPGGTDGIMRAFVKRLAPEAIAGGTQFADIYNGAVRFEALDRPDQATRMRLASTVVAVEPEGARDKAERVAVTYLRDGRLHRVRARGVVVASGSWAAKHVGAYAPELDPDKPNVLTYYVPIKAGLPVEQQGQAARYELLSKSYREYEREVRAQLSEMLSAHGFDARRDIAGIILNRWGHAYVDPYPGFYFGRNGEPAPRDVVREPLGRIAFGHSELTGWQTWFGAVAEGRRAVEQVLGARG